VSIRYIKDSLQIYFQLQHIFIVRLRYSLSKSKVNVVISARKCLNFSSVFSNFAMIEEVRRQNQSGT